MSACGSGEGWVREVAKNKMATWRGKSLFEINVRGHFIVKVRMGYT